MVTRDDVATVVRSSGLWNGDGERTHGFLLSPDAFELPECERLVLVELGRAIVSALQGLTRIAAIACTPHLGNGSVWKWIAKLVRTGVPSIYHELQVRYPHRIPMIVKVDLLRDAQGNYCIAEIDGHNKHGLGYSVLTARIRRALYPNAVILPGVAVKIAEAMRQRGTEELVLITADQERFYLPECEILRAELAECGIAMQIFSEGGLQRLENAPVEKWKRRKKRSKPVLLVDFPFLYHNPELNALLADLYRSRRIDFLIQPKPFLGSKALLAFLRNEGGDAELEAVLRSQIPGEALGTLRSHLPKTYFTGRGGRSVMDGVPGGRWVLKETISSGMKGTIFSDEPLFPAARAVAEKSYFHFVLQEEVQNEARVFSYFTPEGELRDDQWYMRITVHYSVSGIADIIVTARRDRRVHGAPDCLQLGTVIT